MYCWPGGLIGILSVGAAVLTAVSRTVFTFENGVTLNPDDMAVVEALALKAVASIGEGSGNVLHQESFVVLQEVTSSAATGEALKKALSKNPSAAAMTVSAMIGERITLENKQKVEISVVGVGAVASGGRLYPQAVKSIVNGTASPVTSRRMHDPMVTYLLHGGSMAAVLEKAGVEKNDEGMRKLS